MTETQTDNFSGGIATLASDPKPDFADDDPWEVSGVALPVNTIVNGGQNTDHYYPESVLERAADMLEGAQIVKDFHEIEGQAPASKVIGKVTSAGYEKGVGLVFNGEVSDVDIAQKISNGYLDVSPTVARSLGAFDEDMGAQPVEQVTGFRDVAVVANGQPGATIEIGSNPSVTALGMDALSRGFDTLQEGEVDLTPPQAAQENAQMALDAREETGNPNDCGTDTGWTRANQLVEGDELSRDVVARMAQFARHEGNKEQGEEGNADCGWMMWKAWGGDEGVEWAQRKMDQLDTNAKDILQGDMKTVAGVSFRGTRDGKLEEGDIPTEDFESHYLYPGENKSESSYAVVDADGYLRKGNVNSAHSLGCRGDCPDAEEHDTRLMQLAEEFETVPEWAQEDTMQGIRLVETNPGVDENTVTLVKR